MGNFGHVHRITTLVGGREITFRSKLEYRWCVWLQEQKRQQLIQDWWYEDKETLLELETPYHQNIKKYLPDFTILNNDGEYEFHETKGWFTAKDYTKLKLAAEQYDNPITLIFARKPNAVQLRRAERLKPHIKRIIYNADKTIFKAIKWLMEI